MILDCKSVPFYLCNPPPLHFGVGQPRECVKTFAYTIDNILDRLWSIPTFLSGASEAFTCDAFPGTGIPPGILNNEIDHRYPVDGDNGMQFVSVVGVPDWVDEIEFGKDSND